MILDRSVLEVLLPGLTHYIDTGKGEPAAMFFGPDQSAYMRVPAADMVMKGKWVLTDDGYVVDWTGGPKAAWHIDHDAGAFAYLDAEKVNRGFVVRIVPGNAENLS